jgi:hypothetical protein
MKVLGSNYSLHHLFIWGGSTKKHTNSKQMFANSMKLAKVTERSKQKIEIQPVPLHNKPDQGHQKYLEV